MFFIILINKLLADNSCNVEHCLQCDDYSCEVCEDGYISDYYNYQCLECHKTCKNCNYGTTAEDCTQCFDGFYLDDPWGYGTGTCNPCSEDGLCAKCDSTSQHKCTDCIKNYYLDKSSNKCLPCHKSCGSCSGPDDTQCLTCKEGYIENNGKCTLCTENCVECKSATECSKCEDQFFLDTSFHCQKCDDSCKTCHGTTANDCDECLDGYYNNNGLCRQCSTNCAKCDGDRDHCTSCKDGQYLDKEKFTCNNCDIKCKTCNGPNKCETCADGYARESEYDECEKCDSKCGTCAYFLVDYNYNELYCTTCAVNYYPEKISYIDGAVRCQKTGLTGCLVAVSYSECQTCMQGYYKDGKKCFQCDKSCLTCESKDKCSSCDQGFYIDEVTSLCKKCSSNCEACKSDKSCTKCADNYYISDGYCSKCDKSCLTCNDGTNACIECATGYYFDEFKRCQKCSDNCDVCTDATHCTDCATEFFIDTDGSCTPCADVCFECTGPTAADCLECDPGYYLSKSLKKCFKCNEACSVCTGPNDYECSKCADGYFLLKDADIAPGKYGDKCAKCENGCKTCTSTTECKECLEGYYFKNENCEHCPLGCKNCSAGVTKCTECYEGYYAKDTDGNLVNCSRCPVGCDSCSRDESGKLICSSCFDGYYFKDKRCIKCTSPCSTCKSDTECTSCIEGHLLEGTSCSSQCSSTCSSCLNSADSCTGCNDGFILNGTICLQCPVDCKTCEIEGDASLCTSCFEGYYLNKGKCSKCYYECATCFDNSKYCYTCNEGYYKYTQNEYYYGFCQECYLGTSNCSKCTSDFPEGKVVFTCLECDNGYFLKDNECKECHPSCKTCDGTTEQNCITCRDDYFLIDGKCLQCSDSCLTCSTSPTNCTSCKSHQYLENNKCFECSDSCVECKDSKTCTQCPESKFLHEGKCINSCLDAGEGWGANDNHECVKCNLENCNKYDEYCKCTSCNDGYYHKSDPVTLIEFCLPCKLDNCKTCSGSELNDCTECINGFELRFDQEKNEKYCYKLCDDGYFVNASGKCEKCRSPCKICSGIDGSICNECEDGYFLGNNTCNSFPIDCEQEKHCENENKGDKPVQITIEITKFESFKNEQSGGALRIVNCGVTGEKINFNECTSQKGGGGAIFIYNNKDIDQPVSLKDMTFTSCQAAYGGAIYIYSISESLISIDSCKFTNNNVYSSKGSSDSKLFGGSSLYLTVKNGDVNRCTFISNQKLNSGIIKVTENFDVEPEGLMMLHQNKYERLNSIEITECSFEIDDGSNSSIVYVVDKQTSQNVEKHHIAKNVHVSEDRRNELNKKFIEFNLANAKSDTEKKELVVKMSYSSKILMSITSFFLLAIIATVIIIKNRDQHEIIADSIDSIHA